MRALLICICFLVAMSLQAQTISYQTIQNIPYCPDSTALADAYRKERCVLDVYYPKNCKKFATIVWFHGGGLVAGEKEIPQALKEKGFAVVAVNYRLSPVVKAPAYIEDAAAAVSWVYKNIERFGGDTSLVFVAGYSAGAYLTTMIGLNRAYLMQHGIDANNIAGLIALSGQATTHFTIKEERNIPSHQPLIDEFAPLFYVRSDAAPLLLITGDRELEMLGRYEENAYLARMMKHVGHKNTRLFELQGYGHDLLYPAFPLLLGEVHKIIDEKNKNASAE